MSDESSNVLEDEGAGYLVSVSDIMAGLLFIFIITLMAFVLQLDESTQVFEKRTQTLQDRLDEIVNGLNIRAELLETLRNALGERGVEVNINEELGVLTLDERAVGFESAEAEPTVSGRSNLLTVAHVLSDVLPCYSGDPSNETRCSAEHIGRLEAVFIEGHTDSRRLMGQGARTNWNLSADRAINSYRIMRDERPRLGALVNSRKQPLFSVSGYAAQRPRADLDIPSDDARQRRIEMRFIMTPPERNPEVVEELQERGLR